MSDENHISIVHDDPAFIVCRACDGKLTSPFLAGCDPDWCSHCGGTGEDSLDFSTLATLAHNLGVAAGLCASFELGELSKKWSDLRPPFWAPGCGRSAP